LIAEEKMIQRERELEGDEFADRDKFVTQAYKDQLAENRKAEEAEKLREGMNYFGNDSSWF
jgi:coiled-coil domain-containing protein 55